MIDYQVYVETKFPTISHAKQNSVISYSFINSWDKLRTETYNLFSTPLGWLIEKHFLPANIKSWQDGQSGSALLWILAPQLSRPLSSSTMEGKY